MKGAEGDNREPSSYPTLTTHLLPHPTHGHCSGDIWAYFLAPEIPVWEIMRSNITNILVIFFVFSSAIFP